LRFLTRIFLLVFLSSPALAELITDPANPTRKIESTQTFATVNGEKLTWGDYAVAFSTAARNKFYHGKPPEGEVAKLQREVADRMVNRILLLEEVKRRGIKPDQAAIAKQIEQYDKQYAGNERWAQNREKMLPGLKEQLEQQDVLQQIEKKVRDVKPPDEAALEAYYKSHPELFTEPKKVKASVILLSVDPSAGEAAWKAAEEEAKKIIKQLQGGADFAELARIRSSDRTAEKGGDMGWLHKGSLPAPVEAVLEKLKPGQVNPEPVRVLEGIAILRLDGTAPEELKSFGEVKERARALWLREKADEAWKSHLAQLRKKAKVEIDESQFLPLAASGTGEKTQAR
jgi:parvulin-like peptidyl-prolyl isomerase